MQPTVRDVLALDVVARGRPEVLAGADSLDRPVRWVHVAEIADVASLLRGAELVLTTGIALPVHAAGLRRYADELAAVDVAALVVELGRKFDVVPEALVRAAEANGTPLVALHRPIRFVEVTEAVHSIIVAAQLGELRASEHLHHVFTELSVQGADAQAVVRAVADAAGVAVVLENLVHQVLVVEPPGATERALEDWEARSRSARLDGRTGYDAASGFTVTFVGARGEDWGRLVAITDAPPTAQQVTALERGSVTLALNRLAERDRESLERQTHRTLLTRILEHDYTSPADVHARAKALGVPLESRSLLAVVVRRTDAGRPDSIEGQARLRQDTDVVAEAVRAAHVKGLVGALPGGDVGVLLSFARSDRAPALVQRFATSVHAAAAGTVVVAVGSTVDSVADLRRSFREAGQVAGAAPVPRGDRAYVELPDVRVRGLLHLLRDDPRVQTFVERELGPLLPHDDLVAALRAYLWAGRNVSAAAEASYLSRPSFYDRLRRIEGVLHADLADVEVCLSLHVALLALDAIRGSG